MTKNPIILVHGIALRESKYFKAFGRIEKTAYFITIWTSLYLPKTNKMVLNNC